MDQWIVRNIKESRIIGGKQKQIYEIGRPETINGEIPYVSKGSPWGTSNVMAKVGVTKVSGTVFPEVRGNGKCVRLETRLEEVVVLGMINIKALATGTIFTGSVAEPIQDTKNPQSKLMQGIPFSKRIKAIRFDYKAKTGGKRMKATGFSREELPGKNSAEVCVLLQKRWQDAQGNLHAKRIGTAWIRIDKSTIDWVDGFELPLQYGDIRKQPSFRSYMGLLTGEQAIYGQNSQGKNVSVQEEGWGSAQDEVTHLVVRFSAGYGGAYVGAPGDMLWIDNVSLVE